MSADPKTTGDWPERLIKFQTLICLMVALLVAAVCLRIEILNAKAGYYLPRQDFTEIGNQKWRESPITDEEVWVQLRRPAKNGEVDRSPLTVSEQKQMESETSQARAANELREVVRELGLAQYPLGTLVVAWASYILTTRRARHWKWVAMSGFGLAAASLGFAFYRGYYTSLGW